MNSRSLLVYFALLVLLCAGFVVGARMLGQQGMYLAGGYMLTPALAALIARAFFHPSRFLDAGLRLGRWRDYLRFWLYALLITALSYAMLTLFGSIRWDLSGKVFLDLMSQQFAMTGQDMQSSLPPGFTPQMMLLLFTVGGLTVFNILPGIVTGFGEEFGHRGFMFPLLFPRQPWLGFVVGGLLWYAWHLPLRLVMPAGTPLPAWQEVVNQLGLMVGSICTHTLLCYVYARSASIFVPSVMHAALDNAARSLSYFVVLQNPFMGNLAQNLAMVIVILLLWRSGELGSVFGLAPARKAPSPQAA